MNIAAICRRVAELVPAARDISTRDMGKNVHALICTIDGRARCVQFWSMGVWGVMELGWALWPKSDLAIAAEVAKELSR